VGINAAGQVIGNSYTTGDSATRAFFYSGGAMTSLGTLGGTNSFAIGVNSFGQVIGISDTAGNAARHAFLWSAGRMVDLDDAVSGITGFVAAGINDAMQIIGYGMTAAGVRRGFIVTPVPDAAGGLELLGGMMLVAAWAQRRARRRAAGLTG
jgi:probable HAF family extracellular repeat protein